MATDPSKTEPAQSQNGDVDPEETREWLDALDGVIAHDGPERAHELLERLVERGLHAGAPIPLSGTTPYINTIPTDREPEFPTDPSVERALRSAIRWNAMAIVLRANLQSSELGGHIASYQSAATLYEVGFNHFWHAPTDEHGGDLVYMQGHSSPGIYARAFLEGRLTEDQLANFRQEVGGNGLSSYPHPWLMPEFWQFPTVSMGLGPMMAINQARFMKYLTARGLADTTGRKVWAFMGDGEMDEPESMGAIGLGGREGLDNLIFVINCNLQRLDGPVRGNGKIIQELESEFRGAGWNVIKVVWGGRWDPLLEADDSGLLVQRMEEAVDGEYQNFKSRDGAYVREQFFGKYPELLKLVEGMTDDEVWALNRGGHDPKKVYAAYDAAIKTEGKPTVILAKTVKGYGLGESGESQNITHQLKKVAEDMLVLFRDRFDLPLTDKQVTDVELYRPPDESPEMQYLHERREKLGGPLPVRRRTSASFPAPPLETFKGQLEGSADREISTTMAFVRILASLLRDEELSERIVPIVPDESRTFGMEGMFRQLGIYSPSGQLYQPEDADQLMYYREDAHGQVIEEGINEAGAFSSWIAAATSYSNHDEPTIPFYIFYSMFGFQRIGDFAWAAGDSRARGFLLGGTAGRTTLNGEGLQHEDGHSHLISATVPNCTSYDPTFAYEVAVIIREGLRRMIEEQEDRFYYLTLMNENYVHPPMPEGSEEGILRGLYRLPDAGTGGDGPAVQLVGSGTILREAIAGAELLAADFGVKAEVWSAPSFTELRRDALEAERWNQLHPAEKARASWVEQSFEGAEGPVVATSDYMRSFADQIRPWVPGTYRVLGTDGYGRSDYRVALRDFFEVDRRHVAVAALKALADDGAVKPADVKRAISKYEIDPEREPPWLR